MSPRPQSLRGYSDIMHDTVKSLDGSGQKVAFPNENPHHLWESHDQNNVKSPVWHLRVTVLKDQEARGDCPNHIFAFESLELLTRAVNQLEAAFGSVFELKKCGIETPDAMGGRVNDGRSENITIEFDSNAANESWKEFLVKLNDIEKEWERPSESVL